MLFVLQSACRIKSSPFDVVPESTSSVIDDSFLELPANMAVLKPVKTGHAADPKPVYSTQEILAEAASSAFRGGVAGSCAMVANVFCLMWTRTTVSVASEH